MCTAGSLWKLADGLLQRLKVQWGEQESDKALKEEKMVLCALQNGASKA